MRAVKILLVLVVLFGGLFVAADRFAVNYAEDEAAKRVRSAQGLESTDSVTVDIGGFPFLTQAVGRELDEVTVNLRGLRAERSGQQIAVARVDAVLRDVRIAGDLSSATAATATGSAQVTYQDLNDIAPEGVKVSYAGEERAARNQVRLTASIEILGRRVEIPTPIYSSVTVVDGDTLELKAEDLPDVGIPGVEAQVRQRIDFDGGVTGLPAGLELEKVTADGKGLTLSVSGRQVELTG